MCETLKWNFKEGILYHPFFFWSWVLLLPLLDLFLFKDAKIRFESQYSLLWMHLCISAFKSKSTAEARLVVVLGVVDVVVDVVVVVVGILKSLPLKVWRKNSNKPFWWKSYLDRHFLTNLTRTQIRLCAHHYLFHDKNKTWTNPYFRWHTAFYI